jgi:hypothetical protein
MRLTAAVDTSLHVLLAPEVHGIVPSDDAKTCISSE